MSTYGGSTYGGTSPRAVETEFVYITARLTAASSLRATPKDFHPAHLSGEGTLRATATPSATGGSTASVGVQPLGFGTKVLAGATAQVLVKAIAEGVRVPPYTVHPNTRQATNYVPAGEAALASFTREPRSGEGRQLILLGTAPSSSSGPEDENIFDVDHRG